MGKYFPGLNSGEEGVLLGLRASPDRALFPIFLRLASCYTFWIYDFQGALLMEWTTPQHEEIDLNCEVSSYANAEL